MSKTFFDSFGATIPAEKIAKKGGLSYLAAATAVELAGYPEVHFVEFGNQPHLEMLNGSVVAVDLQVPGTEAIQRMWLPVMNGDNLPLDITSTLVTDVNNSRQRCLVKAIAAVYGAGMSVYLGDDGEGPKSVKKLGVSPESDLRPVTPIIATLKEGGAPYIEWSYGLAACRITDPSFRWEVVMWAQADGRQLPYREVLDSLMVDVDTFYMGKRQRLSLPMMDSAFAPLSLATATVFDWNKTVMRCLTKCLAFNTGYGLGVYADEFGVDKDAKAKGRKPASKPVAAPVKELAAEVKVPEQAVAEVAKVSQATQASVTVPEAAPAAEEPQPEATATAVPAAAPEVKPATQPVKTESEALGRFRDVMRKRREVGGIAGVISLFEALATSAKFAPEDKPACFAALVVASASIVDQDHIVDLVSALQSYEAMQYLAADSRERVAAKVTSVLLQAACAVSDEALATATEDLVSAGVAQDVNEVLHLAVVGNVPVETLDLLKDVLEQTKA